MEKPACRPRVTEVLAEARVATELRRRQAFGLPDIAGSQSANKITIVN